MNDNLTSGIDQTSHSIGPSSSQTNLIGKSETASSNVSIPTTKESSPSNIPNNETQSFILESETLMCASTGTISLSVRPESLNNGQNNSNVPNALSNSRRNSISK